MKISREWLQTFFNEPLPHAQAIADALTFHAFEIESVEKVGSDDALDVKVTPNRGHDCLCHRGIAKELSAILDLPFNAEKDPLARKPDLSKATKAVSISIEDQTLCKRYVAGYVKGVKVGPSPDWLKQSLGSIGQRSINNIVDATNFVMFNIGQPLHAFDAGKLARKDGKHSVVVRSAKQNETMLALDDKAYALSPSDIVIVDGNADAVIGIAGVKGGKSTGIDERTTDVILEAANFDGASVRKTARRLGLRTDASDRFQQVLSPELAAYGMREAVDLIREIAGGEVQGFADAYPLPQEIRTVAVSLEKINKVLGTAFGEKDVTETFSRLGLANLGLRNPNIWVYEIQIPFERLDLTISEDLIEEVARIIGYDTIPAAELPPFPKDPEINAMFLAAERKREELAAKGYSEVMTSVFAEKGERVVANKIDGVRSFLRGTLVDGLSDAYERNVRNKDLLGLSEVKLFEIGVVWKGGKEVTALGIADKSGVREESLEAAHGKSSAYEDLPLSSAERYRPFSRYPFIVRDIALWVPAGTNAGRILEIIRAHAGDLLVRSEQFDEFQKGDRTSLAFRLVFQSFERTLTDEEANTAMEKVYEAVKARGWEVR